VTYSPWWTDASGGGTATEGAGGTLVIPAGATTAQQQAIIACAAGKTVTYAGSPSMGGVVINTNGVTINLNGVKVGPGSPAFTINADDVSILGPGLLDGLTGIVNHDTPAILVNAGADNFTLNGVEITRWSSGVQVAGAVTSLKIMNNWMHNNTHAGLDVAGTVGGVVTIKGNLFKANDGDGVKYSGAGLLDATYNSWGDLGGPNVGAGDGAVTSTVSFAPWTFAELFVDVIPDSEAILRSVAESTSFAVKLKVDAANLYGISFKLTYSPTMLTLTSGPTFETPWNGRCTAVGAPAGTLQYYCNLQSPAAEVTADGGTVATLTFTANGAALTGNGPWTTYFDIDHTEANTSAGAVGGVKVFVNNAGFGDPSMSARNIIDSNDGQIDITGIAKFTGFVDLQGRTNDSGATVEVYGQAAKSVAVLAGGTSSGGGGYTTNYVAPNFLTVGSTYYFQVDAPLYLPTTAVTTSAIYTTTPLSWQQGASLSTRPTTVLKTVILLGGDANNDNVIDIGDATCIGYYYKQPAAPCGTSGSNSDVNGDGTVTLLDLVLMGGNYYRTSSPWTLP
jgi:hypothetical protein